MPLHLGLLPQWFDAKSKEHEKLLHQAKIEAQVSQEVSLLSQRGVIRNWLSW
jgi:hypothetical protein